jgi:hypothetical protein
VTLGHARVWLGQRRRSWGLTLRCESGYGSLNVFRTLTQLIDSVPFHKLSQWLTYSLLEPMQKILGWEITGGEVMTGTPSPVRQGTQEVDADIQVYQSTGTVSPFIRFHLASPGAKFQGVYSSTWDYWSSRKKRNRNLYPKTQRVYTSFHLLHRPSSNGGRSQLLPCRSFKIKTSARGSIQRTDG